MKPIAIDDFCAVRSLANVTFSPEGTSACFTVSQAKKEKNCYESRLYLLKGGRVRALTGGGKESSFCYLDENTVLFAGDREGEKEPSLTSRLYKIALDGGEADLAYTFPIPVSQVFPLKNGDLLVVGSTFPGFEDLYKGDKKLVKAYFDDKKENEDYEVISQLPWWWNGGTYTRGAYESLFYYDAKKKSLTRLTDAGFNVSDVQLSTSPSPAPRTSAVRTFTASTLPRAVRSSSSRVAPTSSSRHTRSASPSCSSWPRTASSA